MIVYPKLAQLLRERGISSYTVKRSGLIGQATFKKLQTGGHIDTRTIDALCKMLDCQPGAFLEYVPDQPQ